MARSSPEKLKLFLSAFRGRSDVYALARLGDGDKPTYHPVEGSLAEAAMTHLLGRQTLGIYPLLPDGTTWFLAVDFDGHGAQTDAVRFFDALRALEIPSYLERSRSGRGMHCWVFFDRPVAASKARTLGKVILDRIGVAASFDRFFPSQDFHSGKGLGNLIALPLQGQSQAQGRTLLLDPISLEPYECQWTVLESLEKVTLEQLEVAVAEAQQESHYVPLPLLRHHRESAPTAELAKLRIRLREHVEVQQHPRIMEFLREQSTLPNPEWYRRQRAGLHTFDTPRNIRVGGPLGDIWVLPRGVRSALLESLHKQSIEAEVLDERVGADPLSWPTQIVLKAYQEQVVRAVLAQEESVVVASTGSGKTVMALEVMARRGVPTLVLVHNRNLLRQWQERISQYLQLSKRQIGGVRTTKIRLGAQVTICTFQSLLKRDLATLADHFAQVVVDECHHTPARSFAAVLRQLRPRYLLGLTATAQRKDQLEKLIFLYLGLKTSAPSTRQLDQKGDIVLPHLRVRSTDLTIAASLTHQGRIEAVGLDDRRNQLIAEDALEQAREGHQILILTDRVEHCDRLESLLLGQVSLATLHGPVARSAEAHLLNEFQEGKVQVLIATRKRLGEGWDCPRLSTLILASPISGRGSDLTQMIGRLTRPGADKAPPVFIDYLDQQVPIFLSMFQSRLRLYRKLLRPDLLPLEYRAPKRQGKAKLDYGPKQFSAPNVCEPKATQLMLF